MTPTQLQKAKQKAKHKEKQMAKQKAEAQKARTLLLDLYVELQRGSGHVHPLWMVKNCITDEKLEDAWYACDDSTVMEPLLALLGVTTFTAPTLGTPIEIRGKFKKLPPIGAYTLKLPAGIVGDLESMGEHYNSYVKLNQPPYMPALSPQILYFQEYQVLKEAPVPDPPKLAPDHELMMFALMEELDRGGGLLSPSWIAKHAVTDSIIHEHYCACQNTYMLACILVRVNPVFEWSMILPKTKPPAHKISLSSSAPLYISADELRLKFPMLPPLYAITKPKMDVWEALQILDSLLTVIESSGWISYQWINQWGMTDDRLQQAWATCDDVMVMGQVLEQVNSKFGLSMIERYSEHPPAFVSPDELREMFPALPTLKELLVLTTKHAEPKHAYPDINPILNGVDFGVDFSALELKIISSMGVTPADLQTQKMNMTGDATPVHPSAAKFAEQIYALDKQLSFVKAPKNGIAEAMAAFTSAQKIAAGTLKPTHSMLADFPVKLEGPPVSAEAKALMQDMLDKLKTSAPPILIPVPAVQGNPMYASTHAPNSIPKAPPPMNAVLGGKSPDAPSFEYPFEGSPSMMLQSDKYDAFVQSMKYDAEADKAKQHAKLAQFGAAYGEAFDLKIEVDGKPFPGDHKVASPKPWTASLSKLMYVTLEDRRTPAYKAMYESANWSKRDNYGFAHCPTHPLAILRAADAPRSVVEAVAAALESGCTVRFESYFGHSSFSVSEYISVLDPVPEWIRVMLAAVDASGVKDGRLHYSDKPRWNEGHNRVDGIRRWEWRLR